MNIGQIILDELNDWVFNVEDQAGNKMNVVEDCDFKEIIPNLVKKLTIPVVIVPKNEGTVCENCEEPYYTEKDGFWEFTCTCRRM